MCSPFTLRGNVATLLAALLVISLSACSKQDQISTYEEPETPTTESTPGTPARPASMPRSVEKLKYDTPEGWTPGQVGGMRKAAFVVEKDDKKVEVTVIDLAEMAGALLPNVNRWRQQVQLGEITQEEMDESLTEIPVAGVQGHFVEMVGPEDADARQAILAIVAMRGGKAWFFKLWGDPELAQQEKDRFLAFAKSVKFEAAAAADPHAGIPGMSGMPGMGGGADPHAGIPGMGGMPGMMPGGQGATATKPADFSYKTPEGWAPQQAQGMRKAAFLVRDGNKFAEVTVIDMAGSAGELLPNVNRWRDQIKLEQVSQEELDKQMVAMQVGGKDSYYVELISEQDPERPASILGVIVPQQDKTWFVKMLGDTEVVLQQREKFKSFAESLAFKGEQAAKAATEGTDEAAAGSTEAASEEAADAETGADKATSEEPADKQADGEGEKK